MVEIIFLLAWDHISRDSFLCLMLRLFIKQNITVMLEKFYLHSRELPKDSQNS